MRRHLREAARAAGDTLPSNDCLSVMIRRWESDRSGVSERYRMHFCRMLQITIDQFGHAPVPPAPHVIPATTASPAPAHPPPSQAGHLEHAPAPHDPEPVSRAYPTAHLRPGLDAAFNDAGRGLLAGIPGPRRT